MGKTISVLLLLALPFVLWAQEEKKPEDKMPVIWILDNADKDYEKPPFDDNLTVMNSDGTIVAAFKNVNMCDTIGGGRPMAITQGGRAVLVAELGGNRLTRYNMEGKKDWSIRKAAESIWISKNHAYVLAAKTRRAVQLLSAKIEPKPVPELGKDGIEIYSWRDQGAWRFFCRIGPVQVKTFDEISDKERAADLATIENLISKAPERTRIWWNNPSLVTGEGALALPPDDVFLKILKWSRDSNLPVRISLGAPERAEPSVLDKALARVTKGEFLPYEDEQECHQAFKQYWQALAKKYNTREESEYGEEDRLPFFVAAVKMAVISSKGHSRWPFNPRLGPAVLDQIKVQINQKQDPFLIFCSIFPALASKDPGYAIRSFRKLQAMDPFWAEAAVLLIVNAGPFRHTIHRRSGPFFKTLGIKPDPPLPENSLLVVDVETGAVKQELGLRGWDIAIDEDHNALWIVGDDIIKLALDSLKVSLRTDPIEFRATSVDYTSDGGIWVAIRRKSKQAESRHRIIRLSSEGKEEAAIVLGGSPRCVSVNREDDSVWVASGGTVRHYNRDLDLLLEIANTAAYVRVDPQDGSVWVASFAGKVMHYSAEGDVLLNKAGFASGMKWLEVYGASPQKDD